MRNDVAASRGKDHVGRRHTLPGREMKRAACAAFVLVAGLVVGIGAVSAQTTFTLTLTATPDPVTLGGTITLTATLNPAREGVLVTFQEEASPGCRCGEFFGTAVTDATGTATLTLPATSPPLIAPAIRTHHLLADAFVGLPTGVVFVEARTTVTVVCPEGQNPDTTGNACVAAGSAMAFISQVGSHSVTPAVPTAFAGTPARSAKPTVFPLSTALIVAAIVFQLGLGLSFTRGRRAG